MKLLQFTITLFILGATLSSCNSSTSKQDANQEYAGTDAVIEVLDMETYLSRLDEEERPFHFVDVRTPEEVSEGTISNAMNIDYMADDFLDKFKTLDKDQPVYLFCRSGNRSGKASKLLVEEGFKEIYDLKGGYSAYSARK